MYKLRLGPDMICHELREYIAYARLSTGLEAQTNRFEIYDPSTSTLHPECLYICLAGSFPPLSNIVAGTILISTTTPSDIPQSPLPFSLIVVKNISELALINEVSLIFSRFNYLSNKLEIYALHDSTIQNFVDTAWELLRAPVCLMDLNRNIIVKSSSKTSPSANPLWNAIVQDDDQMLSKLLHKSREVQITGAGTIPHNPHMRVLTISGCKVIELDLLHKESKRASLWAFQTRRGSEDPLIPGYIIEWLGRLLDGWLDRTTLLKAGRGKKTESFLLDLANGTLSDEQSVHDAIERLKSPVFDRSEHQMLVLKPRAKDSDIWEKNDKLYDMLDSLESIIPDSIFALDGKTPIGIIGIDAYEYLDEEYSNKIEKIAKSAGYIALLSTPYLHIYDSHKIYRQLLSSFELINYDDSDKALFHYYNYMVEQSMRIVMTAQPVETMYHPMVRRLMSYDLENNTDYLETFKVYLNNNCNVTETASQLYMHRNTLLHRIKRIEEILGTPFVDWETRRRLLLSFDYFLLARDLPL